MFPQEKSKMYSINIDKNLEVRGIDPRAFRMQIERSTTELYPRAIKSQRD